MIAPIRGGLVAVLLICGHCVVFALPATAGEVGRVGIFVVHPCASEATLGHSFEIQLFANAWSLADECPAALVLRSDGDLVRTLGQQWRFRLGDTTQTNIDAVSVAATAIGMPAGKRVTLKVCGHQCGKTIQLPSGDARLNVDLSVADGEIPSDAKYFQIAAACVDPGDCPPEGVVEFRDLAVDYRDPDPPTVGWEDQWDGSFGGMSFAEGAWLPSGIAPMRLLATDAGTGVQSLTAVLDEGVEVFHGLCGPESTGWCWGNEADWGYVINTWQLPDGHHRLMFTANDPAGNRSPVRAIDFGVDKVRPPAPTNVHAEGTSSSGWVNASHVTVRWTNTSETHESETESGIERAIFSAPWNQPNTPGVSTSSEADNISAVENVRLNEGTNKIIVAVADRAGNLSTSTAAVIRRDSTVLKAPVLEGSPVTNRHGADIRWQRPPNAVDAASGICGYAISTSVAPEANPGDQVVVPGDVTQSHLEPLPEGISYVHLRAISCSGVAGEIAHIPAFSDLRPPEVHASLPTSRWIGGGAQLKLSATDAESRDVSISYALDGAATVTHLGSEVLVHLAPGRHELRYWATDAAGNDSVVAETDVGSDPHPPTGAFGVTDRDNPRLVRGYVNDELSGVSDARMEFRRQGSIEDWQPLGRPVRLNSSEPPSDASLVAEFPDSTEPAAFELRLVFADKAGNQGTSGAFADGTPAGLSTPLRAAPVLAARFAAAAPCSSRNACSISRRRALLPFASGVTIAGRLTDATGRAMPQTTLQLTTQSAPVLSRQLMVITDSSGAFRAKLRGMSSRKIVVRYIGSGTLLPARAELRLDVRSAVTLRAVPRRTGLGTIVWLTGKVRSGDTTLPAGQPVVIEYRARNRWRRLMPNTRVFTKDDGSFAAGYPLGKLREPLHFRVRARIPAGRGWPFSSGVSDVQSFVARPQSR